MSELQLRPFERQRPLVAAVCSVPLLGEAMGTALEFADVLTFSARGGDISGLLQWLRPDAVVVDDEEHARGAEAYVSEWEIPLLHISVRDRTLHLFHHGSWHDVANGEGPTPEVIRNVVAGTLFARGSAR